MKYLPVLNRRIAEISKAREFEGIDLELAVFAVISLGAMPVRTRPEVLGAFDQVAGPRSPPGQCQPLQGPVPARSRAAWGSLSNRKNPRPLLRALPGLVRTA
jgi:hypothetical protein